MFNILLTIFYDKFHCTRHFKNVDKNIFKKDEIKLASGYDEFFKGNITKTLE
jgi:hypothetical protein